MAKKRSRAKEANVDWYLISIERLKQVGLIVLIVLLGAASYFYWQKEKGNPRSNAETAIADARQALNQLASSKDFNAHRPEFDRAQRKLDEANSLFATLKYVEAQGAAVESQTISRTALSGGADRENDAQFLTVEGDVKYQKGSSGDWKDADPRTPLFNGDWVKTGDHSSAELIFSNGSLYTVNSNALLEIYSQLNPATSKKTNEVKMQIGSVEVATTDDESSVRTPGTRVVVDSESTSQVAVTKGSETSVVATKGSASVTSTAGGEAVKLNTGEKINATPAGQVSPVKKLLLPPALLGPSDNQVFQLTGDLRVQFQWDVQPGATGYVLQVSRSRLFSTLEINSKRQNTQASARVTSEGSFFWRVASVGPDGDVGPFASFRRFRVSGGQRSGTPVSADREPPTLTLNRPYSIGGPFFMIEGSTEPGATVFINDDEVDVESNGQCKKLGSFNKTGANAVVVKAIDAAGNQTVKSETVFVEE